MPESQTSNINLKKICLVASMVISVTLSSLAVASQWGWTKSDVEHLQAQVASLETNAKEENKQASEVNSDISAIEASIKAIEEQLKQIIAAQQNIYNIIVSNKDKK